MLSNLFHIEIKGKLGTMSSTRMGKTLVFEYIDLRLKGILVKGPRVRKHITIMMFIPRLSAPNLLKKSSPNPLKFNTNTTDKLLLAYMIDFVCFLILSL